MSERTTTEVLTTTGRLVGGSLWQGQDKDDEGRPYQYKSGSRIGQPFSKYSFGIAFEKTNPEMIALKQQVEAMVGSTVETNPNFAWKITDGDSQIPNLRGKKPCEREGYQGHWVIWFSGTDAPRCFDQQRNPLTDPQSIKKGYYVRVLGSYGPNGDTRKPGLYWNYTFVQLCGYGAEIITGPDANEALSAPIAAAPAGMSATPVAPAAAPPAPAAAPPAPAAAPPAPAAAPPAPAAAAPAPPAPPAPPAAPAPDFAQGPKMLKNGHKYDDYIAAGWTDETLKANGLLD